MNLPALFLRPEPMLIRADHAHLPLAIARSRDGVPPAALAGADDERMPWEEREAVSLVGSLAIIQVRGMLCAGCDAPTAWYYDLARPEALQSALAAVQTDARVEAVLLEFDSPGGYVTAIPETAALLAAVAAEKPVFAFTSGLCCSAAYWLASQCAQIYATPSADVGSVGTYAAIYDYSAMFAAAGVSVHVLREGALKAIGIPGDKVTAEQLTYLQAGVARVNGKFIAAVRAGRGELAAEDLQGQWFDGEQAVEKRLADATVMNRAQLLALLFAAADLTVPLAAAPAPRGAQSAAPASQPANLNAQPGPMTFNVTLPAINVTQPPVNVSVDSRFEKDAISVTQTNQGSGAVAKRIITDADGRPIGIAPVETPPPSKPN